MCVWKTKTILIATAEMTMGWSPGNKKQEGTSVLQRMKAEWQATRAAAGVVTKKTDMRVNLGRIWIWKIFKKQFRGESDHWPEISR
jgi:hypothetical protein